MGWFGDYSSTEEVIEEKKRLVKKEAVIIETKNSKNYGAILYTVLNDNGEIKTAEIDFFIFADTMYKPISWANRPDAIPKKWINQVLPFAEDYEKEMYKEFLERSEKQKEKKKELESFLEKGTAYLIWGRHKAVYYGKIKRSHIFLEMPNSDTSDFDPDKCTQLTRFRHLRIQDLQKMEEISCV